VGMAVQRAQDKTAQMQARAGAIDELMASGALDDVTAQPNDDIQRELDQMGGGHDVDRELERMKVELGGGEAPREIEGSTPDAAGNTSTSNGQAGKAADQPQSGDGA
jgi:phage shock protein A